MDKIKVFDTTLRDGAQTPEIGMNFSDRLYIAKALADTGVDVVEIGFAANDADFGYMRDLARYIGSGNSRNRTVPVVCSLARVVPEDVELAYRSIELADPAKRRIHLFIGTSEELMSYSHGKREESILEMVSRNVERARTLVGREGSVEYSSEDSMRTDVDFLIKTIQRAVDAGADVINVPDTTGFAKPDRYYDVIRQIRNSVGDGVTYSAHIHNDSGNAVATTLKGIEAGVRQVEGCVLQLGERTGNADWMTVVNDLNIFGEYDVRHMDSTRFYNLAKLVAAITNQTIPLTHPVVGRAAFTESSGIHVKGVLRNYSTYFVTPPASVGRTMDIVLGQTSGTNTVAHFLKAHDYECAGDLSEMTSAVKRYSIDVGDSLTGTEAQLLAEHYVRGRPLERRIHMKDYRVVSSMNDGPFAKVVLDVDGTERTGEGSGKGPVDSFMNAVEEALGIKAELHHWDEKAVYRGKGAPGYEFLDNMKFGEEELAALGTNGESSGQSAVARSMIELLYERGIYHGRGSARGIDRATYDAIINGFDAVYRLNPL